MAGQSGALVYSIGIADTDDPDRNPGVLNRLARATGGEAYFPSQLNEVVAICERIARDIRNQYTLGYVSTSAALPGVYRSIRVVPRELGTPSWSCTPGPATLPANPGQRRTRALNEDRVSNDPERMIYSRRCMLSERKPRLPALQVAATKLTSHFHDLAVAEMTFEILRTTHGCATFILQGRAAAPA